MLGICFLEGPCLPLATGQAGQEEGQAEAGSHCQGGGQKLMLGHHWPNSQQTGRSKSSSSPCLRVSLSCSWGLEPSGQSPVKGDTYLQLPSTSVMRQRTEGGFGIWRHPGLPAQGIWLPHVPPSCPSGWGTKSQHIYSPLGVRSIREFWFKGITVSKNR